MMHRTSEFNTTVPKYLERLPCAKHAWPDVVSVIKLARDSIHKMNSQTNFVELEMRFGRRMQGFQPGISEQAFLALEKRFDTGREWAKKIDWHNINVFFHGSSVPGDRRKLRTEVTFFPDGSEESKRVESTHKELVSNHDYRTVPLSIPEQNVADIRIALNVEHAVPQADVPDTVEPTSVHLKTRKCYFYAPTGYDAPVWCYVLTKRWTGSTLHDAKLSKAKDLPVFEMEIECLCPKYLTAIDPGQVAAKMLFKACDVLDILAPELRDRAAYIIEPTQNSMLWSRHKHA